MCAVCLVVAGCSQQEKLTPEEAMQTIRQEMEYPKPYVYEIFCADPEYARKVTDAGLESNGLLSVRRTRKIADIGQPLIGFTTKAHPYLLPATEEDSQANIRKVKIADENLVKINGVRMEDDGRKAVVEYTVGYTNVTPFAPLVRADLRKPSPRTARFVLHEDGWRLEKKQ